MQTIVDLFRIETANPDLMRAQMRALNNQVPLLYVILAINSTAVAVTYLGVAPDRITLYPLGGLLALCGLRLGLWLRRRRRPINETRIAARLRLTVALAGALAVGFMAWVIALSEYGDAEAFRQGLARLQ